MSHWFITTLFINNWIILFGHSTWYLFDKGRLLFGFSTQHYFWVFCPHFLIKRSPSTDSFAVEHNCYFHCHEHDRWQWWCQGCCWYSYVDCCLRCGIAGISKSVSTTICGGAILSWAYYPDSQQLGSPTIVLSILENSPTTFFWWLPAILQGSVLNVIHLICWQWTKME